MLPTNRPAVAPYRVRKESEDERLARIIRDLRQRRKRIIVIINPDGSMFISRAEHEGSFESHEKV